MPLRHDPLLDEITAVDGRGLFRSGRRGRILFPFPLPPLPVPQPQPLPEVLYQAGQVKVVHGDDPGNFYCEHLFYLSQKEAVRAGSQVLKNAYNESLVGFLHMPWDNYTEYATAVTDQAGRHQGNRQVVGLALMGWFLEVADRVADPVRLMLTGYDTFQSVKNNPTADFVQHKENIDAALQFAFGAALTSPQGTVQGGRDADHDDGERTLVYQVNHEGRSRTIHLHTERFSVTDTTLDSTQHNSLPQAMRTFRPYAMMGMGVHGGAEYLAEHQADAGGLDVSGAQPRHQGGAPESGRLEDNFALARAILKAVQARQLH